VAVVKTVRETLLDNMAVVVHNGKSEAKVISVRRLHLTYYTVEALTTFRQETSCGLSATDKISGSSVAGS